MTNRFVTATCLFAGLFLGGCGAATTAKPLRYVAVSMPASVARDVAPTSHVELEVTRRTWGGFYRSPQDVAGVVEQLQVKAGVPVLQNADVRLQTAPCYVVVCIGNDLASAGADR